MRSGIQRATTHFLKTTTLHGFKYLSLPYYIDRVWWVSWCCLCVCGGGLLCSALWARFLQRPALLALLHSSQHPLPPPLVALCPTPARLARLYHYRFPLQNHSNIYLPSLFYQIIKNKPIPPRSLKFLERALVANKLTSLVDMLMLVMPSCDELINKCQWRKQEENCNRLFEKVITAWGVCCIAWSNVLEVMPESPLNLLTTLDLMFQCTDDNDTQHNGCEFFIKYRGEDWVVPMELTKGYQYKALVTYSMVIDSSKHLVDTSCESEPNYSMRQCLIRCEERKCKCSDPRRMRELGEEVLPPCPLHRINCLTSFKQTEDSCKCPQACKKIFSDVTLEQTPLIVANTFDHFFEGANASTHTVLSIVLSDSGSKVFDLTYTETWWSLLSSLGGVFNMFLGLGLFSALELLFFLLARLPLAIRRSTDVQAFTATVR